MKNSLKKLKTKHFRYLTKEDLDDPMNYLIQFYAVETNLTWWLADINTAINASVNAKMRAPICLFIGYSMKQLIRQVEAAYVIYKKYNIQKQEEPLDFFYTNRDYWNFRRNRGVTKNEKNMPYDSISRFFSYQNLSKWYETLDTLWINLTDRETEINDYELLGEDYVVAIKELFIRLATELYHLFKAGEFPEYEYCEADVVSENKENIASATTGPSSNLCVEESLRVHKPEKNLMPHESIKVNNPEIDVGNNNADVVGNRADNTYRCTVLEKIRATLLNETLDEWQVICDEIHLGVNTEYEHWNDAFKQSDPGSLHYYSISIHKLIKLVDDNFLTICDPDKFDFTAITSSQTHYQFFHKQKVMTFKYLSQYELLKPEYYLYTLFDKYPISEWCNEFNEVIEIYLSLKKSDKFYGNGDSSYFMLQLQKFIELCYLIGFKDEIEFMNHSE